MADTAKITEKFRVFNAKQFVESFDESTSTNHYFFIGRSSDWETLVEYYGQTTATAPQVGDTVSFEPLTGYPGTTHATITEIVDGGFLCSGLDPAALTNLAFAQDFTYPAGGANAAKVLKIRPANEDEVLRPADNQEEKYDYYNELIAAKRIYNDTLGQNTGSSPDQSYLTPVIPRIDYGVDNGGLPVRSEPYDMWHPGYAGLNGTGNANFTRYAPSDAAAVGERSTQIADLEMIVRTADYNVWMCIDNNYDPATGLAASPDPGAGPSLANPNTTPGTTGFCSLNGVYTSANGYRWKYLYSMDIESVVRFQSQRFIPFLPFDASNTAAVAVAGPEVGNVLDAGSGYLGGGSGTLYAPIKGDGQAADGSTLKVMELTITSGAITKARAMVIGETGYVAPGWSDAEYTYANIELVDGDAATPTGFKTGLYTDPLLTTAATAPVNPQDRGFVEVVIPPQGGYGSDGLKGTAGYDQFLEQMNVKRVMANIRLTFDEGDGDFPVTNDFRRIGLLRDPKGYNGAGGIDITNANSADYETVRNTYTMVIDNTVSNAANFNVDETISQTITLSDNSTVVAKGTVVEWTPVNEIAPNQGGILRYYQDASVHSNGGKVHQFIDTTTATAQAYYSNTGAGDLVGDETGNHAVPPTATVSQYAWSDIATITTGAVGTSYSGITTQNLYPELEPYTGEMLYVENRRLITRAIDQIEDIKLVIEF